MSRRLLDVQTREHDHYNSNSQVQICIFYSKTEVHKTTVPQSLNSVLHGLLFPRHRTYDGWWCVHLMKHVKFFMCQAGPTLLQQSNALLRKNAVYQKRRSCLNISIILLPLIFVALLKGLQAWVDHVAREPQNQVGFQLLPILFSVLFVFGMLYYLYYEVMINLSDNGRH